MECLKQCLAHSMSSSTLPGTEETKVKASHPLPKPRLQVKGRKTSSSNVPELC